MSSGYYCNFPWNSVLRPAPHFVLNRDADVVDAGPQQQRDRLGRVLVGNVEDWIFIAAAVGTDCGAERE